MNGRIEFMEEGEDALFRISSIGIIVYRKIFRDFEEIRVGERDVASDSESIDAVSLRQYSSRRGREGKGGGLTFRYALIRL